MILYFGCRRRDEDYIYSDEIETWRQSGTLSEVEFLCTQITNTRTVAGECGV